jgi:EmrB/QacA subfamily drug resistance transporter
MPGDEWMTTGAGHPRRWAVLGVLVICLLVVVIDTTIMNIALPTIQQDLQASQSELLWSVTAFVLVFASALFAWGVIGDRIGRRRVLLIGMVVFGVASALCAFAPTPHWLVAFRALQGAGAAAVMPTTLAIITVVFPPHERGRAIGAWAGATGAAVALGPVLGGLLLQYPQATSWLTGNDWGAVFLINVPFVVVGVAGIVRVVPESRSPQPRPVDAGGLVLSVLGLFALVYGIIHVSNTGTWLHPGVLLPVGVGAVLLTVFLVAEARSEQPSFDVSLFRNRTYTVALTAVTLAFFALSGITFYLPFYLQILRGLDTVLAGLCFLPFALGQLLAAPRSAALVERFGYRTVLVTGLLLICAALAALAGIAIDTPLWFVLAAFLGYGMGMGLVVAPGSTLLQNVLPLARAGAGSAVQNTVRQVGGALGVAILGTVLANRYAERVAVSLGALPPDFPPQAKQAAAESVIATDLVLQQAVAAGLPPEIADSVRGDAFVDFLAAAQLATVIALGVVLVAAAVVAFLLPPVVPPSAGQAPPGGPPEAAGAVVRREVPDPAAGAVQRRPDGGPGAAQG